MIRLRMPEDELAFLKTTVHPELLKIKNKPCTRCILTPAREGSACTQIVPPVGNVKSATTLLLGQSPGSTEDFHGVGMCGPQYFFLKEFHKRGMTWDDMVLANTLWCHPQDNEKARLTYLKACRHNLEKLISLMPNIRLIVLVGGDALKMVEGPKADLGLRLGGPGHQKWVVAGKEREFFTFPMYHPAHIGYLESEEGKLQARRDMYDHINWVVDAHNNLKAGGKLEIGYKHTIAETKEQAKEMIYWLAKQSRLAVDFETWGSSLKTAPVGVAFSWKPLHAVWIWFYRYNPIPEEHWYKYRTINGCNWHTVKGALTDWYEPGSAREIIAWLKDSRIFENPFLSIQHAQFEMSVGDWLGIPIRPKFDDLSHSYALSFDTAVQMRNVLHTQRINLQTVLQACYPLEASTKDVIADLIPKNEIDVTGFATMAIKPNHPREYYYERADRYRAWLKMIEDEQARLKKEKKRSTSLSRSKKVSLWDGFQEELLEMEANWLPQANKLKSELLAERGMLDADWEFRLNQKFQALSESDCNISGTAINMDQILTKMADEI